MIKNRKWRKAAQRVKAGNGRSLKSFRWWQPLNRALFYLPLTNDDDRQAVFAVDVPYWQQLQTDDGKGKAHLYLDGRHHAESKLPAAFPVPGGMIIVEGSVFGLKRCDYVTVEGSMQQLIPDERSAEGRRARLDREHPALSRWIGFLSLIMLIIPIVLAIPQVIEPVSQMPPIAQRFGTFTSPITLPIWLNITLGLCAAAASMERATRLRWNALLDGSS
ncbi:hypothetical protein OIN60_11770 [Paenibacillus sp. P96]|uniref:Uncharacterized protein n=1 Tax=Paenibacillus zeirhizosphaerae TaxID=2987519 RepID=A0ABT9FRU1_9BACL|nr:hypothetical protein [Paenibacillus sp. P96]MDP4097448.1 hypothetical protein [Paenibacillus sp. P96]